MSKISMGIICNYSNSPAHIITSVGMPLQFNISKRIDEMNNIYNDNFLPNYSSSNYPSLTIDTNNSVLINLDKLDKEQDPKREKKSVKDKLTGMFKKSSSSRTSR